MRGNYPLSIVHYQFLKNFSSIIILSFLPAVGYEITLKNHLKKNTEKEMNEFQQYNLLLALALNAQTKATHFDTHGVTDSLIDLEDFSLISHDKTLYQTAESLEKLSQNEILDRIIATAQKLKIQEKKNT